MNATIRGIRATGEPPAEAYAVALAGLPKLGSAALRQMLAGTEPGDAWCRVLAGHQLDVDGAWRHAAERLNVSDCWSAIRRAGIGVHLLGRAGYPRRLAGDSVAPPVLFSLGDVSAVDEFPTVGVVGTRTCTRYGLGVAAQLGAELTCSGAVVVSGLALGIDSAAHEGAVAGWATGTTGSGPPVAVVAGGLDRPYPSRSAALWQRVASAGAILSEAPIGTAVERWRFPRRNRLMAALADVVVVVESHQQGGSLQSARAAIHRGAPVGAVPGSIRSPASAGANDLLADGCFPVRDSTDVIVALELARAGAKPVRPRRTRGSTSRRRAEGSAPDTALAADGAGAQAAGRFAESPDADGALLKLNKTAGGDCEGAVLAAIGWERCSLEQILRRTGRPLAEVSVEIERLATQGHIAGDGSWWERTAPDRR